MIELARVYHELSHPDHMLKRLLGINVNGGTHIHQCKCMAPRELIWIAEKQVVHEESAKNLHLMIDGHLALQMSPHGRTEIPVYVQM